MAIMTRSTRLSRLLSLTFLGLFASLLSTASAGTTSYPYQFNHVAVTGGGYITGIIAHPTEENLLYVRTDIGGAYRWNQDENKWIPITDFISAADSNLLGTESIGLDPTDPDRLYLAQGRYLTSNNSAFFVSTDRGDTFDVVPTPFIMGSNELGRNNGERIAVNPFRPKEVWFGSRTEGLWKSEDYAATWTNVTSIPDAFANTMGIYFVLFDPTKNGTIYIGGSTPGGLYVTGDNGQSWNPVPGQPTTWENSTLVDGEPPLSTGPQPMKGVLTSDGATLYVTYADFPGPYGVQYGVVYKYGTKDSTWTNITPGVGNNSYPPPYEPQTWPPGGFCGLSVDSKDPDTLVVTTLDRDPGPALDSLYLSRDGGKSWKDVAQLSSPNGTGGNWGHPIAEAALDNGTAVPWLSFDYGEEWGGYGAPSRIPGLTKFGWWMSALLMDPSNPGHVLYGTGATIWSTDDVFAAEQNAAPGWYIQAQGIEETVALAMISPSDGPAHLLSGFGDINGMAHDDLWVPQPMFGLPAFSNLDSLDWAGQKPSLVARVGDCGLNYSVYDACGQGTYSTDSGHNWTMFPVCAPGINETTTTDGTITIDASGEIFVWSTLITEQENGPWFSSDAGVSWSAPTGDLNVQTEYISADRVQAGTFYACDSGTFYISTDGGKSYNGSVGSSIGLPAGQCALPVVNFNKAGELWLPLGSNGLYHSSDFGSTWEAVGPSGLEADYFSVGMAAPSTNSTAVTLFLWGRVASSGADSVDGLYRSDDSGTSWARVNDDSHQYGGPTMILGDPRVYGRVFIGTSGRGIIFADIAAGSASSNGSVTNVPGTAGI
ncbi:family 74 glycoside hydrolase [Cryphonectria parasitica EP155]|uniref:Family 74 glycoside hydrolase n=1 Tax=Cryphonectria parasitica (strain ATCC 38755 / EP155) TaxID=660469 RepID=A0A9P4Y0G6_CRYP1|nr:family 74 glycoside hydrolase [Cryphonectria parasitica EP155]KAF3764125.1 family 74 glycoside hydrolase [Cryphonectria parasitica EP155]